MQKDFQTSAEGLAQNKDPKTSKWHQSVISDVITLKLLRAMNLIPYENLFINIFSKLSNSFWNEYGGWSYHISQLLKQVIQKQVLTRRILTVQLYVNIVNYIGIIFHQYLNPFQNFLKLLNLAKK